MIANTWISLNWPRFLSNKLAWIRGSTWNKKFAFTFYCLKQDFRSCTFNTFFAFDCTDGEMCYIWTSSSGPDVNTAAADILAGLNISGIVCTTSPFRLRLFLFIWYSIILLGNLCRKDVCNELGESRPHLSHHPAWKEICSNLSLFHFWSFNVSNSYLAGYFPWFAQCVPLAQFS